MPYRVGAARCACYKPLSKPQAGKMNNAIKLLLLLSLSAMLLTGCNTARRW
jgi:hypothetical protein